MSGEVEVLTKDMLHHPAASHRLDRSEAKVSVAALSKINYAAAIQATPGDSELLMRHHLDRPMLK